MNRAVSVGCSPGFACWRRGLSGQRGPARPRPGPGRAVPAARGRDARVELRQDAAHYFDVHRSASETIDRIVPAELDQVAAVVTLVAHAAADAPADLGRVPEDKRPR